MRSLLAFMRKEGTEHIRSGKLVILGLVFVLFGIMNPAVAKLTPWMLEMMADSLAESGMTVTDVTISAMDSWVQFFKNIPVALIVFVLMESNIFTKEYQTGTLVLSLTKGLVRHRVIVAKTVMLTGLWTVCYWMCFAITYSYNAYFWDNAVAKNLGFAIVNWWLFGLWVIALMILFSTVANANTGVLMGMGGVVFAAYLGGLIPKVGKYLPTLLMDGNSLIYGAADVDTYTAAIVITLVTGIAFVAASIPIFNKKQL